MKFKLFNLTLVCLATLGGLASSQAAFAQGVEQQINPEQAEHLICVKAGQHLLCDIKNSEEREQQLAHRGAVKQAKAAVPLKTSTDNVVPQLLSPAQQRLMANILLGIGYLLPCGVCLGIFLYDKYRTYRCALLQEQIEFLERLWQQSTQH